ncbi:D-alanyl-D-alanine carboxypeptidase [Candidatus Daviesbacteria bacterium]|nr:D-alanyl-D-alanine carboxypeptidase [Candidatus Daviesbacteria bacterium]
MPKKKKNRFLQRYWEKLFYFKLITFLLFIFFLTSGALLLLPNYLNQAQGEITSLSSTKVLSYNIAPEKNEPTKKLEDKIIEGELSPPILTAEAVLALDLLTGQTLYQKNIHKRLPPASTTKLMTALVAIEHYKNPDILTVYPEAIVGGADMGLNPGEVLSFRSLLYGMLLNSGNDASFTIALNYPGGLPMFVMHMNKKAKSLELINTNFDNPAGFDSPNHYSSAYDLSLIAKEAIANPQISRVVATKETTVTSTDSSKLHILKNLNALLSEGFLGIKTGYTENAGENFVGLFEKDTHRILTVVLNSKDRFGETKKLTNWIFQNFTFIKI